MRASIEAAASAPKVKHIKQKEPSDDREATARTA
jgi:hypothetical protein